jgi:hypothetical protein
LAVTFFPLNSPWATVTVTVSDICGFLLFIRDQNRVAKQAMKHKVICTWQHTPEQRCDSTVALRAAPQRWMTGYMTQLRGNAMRHTACYRAMSSRVVQIASNILYAAA